MSIKGKTLEGGTSEGISVTGDLLFIECLLCVLLNAYCAMPLLIATFFPEKGTWRNTLNQMAGFIHSWHGCSINQCSMAAH